MSEFSSDTRSCSNTHVSVSQDWAQRRENSHRDFSAGGQRWHTTTGLQHGPFGPENPEFKFRRHVDLQGQNAAARCVAIT